jgi:hypothetical protein
MLSRLAQLTRFNNLPCSVSAKAIILIELALDQLSLEFI